MKRLPKFRRTSRTDNAALCYYDDARNRWVVYRRACGITRKTSLRGPLSDWALAIRAARMAERIKAWPADRLAEFRF